MYGAYLMRGLLGALWPGWWAFLYQMPLGFAVAYVVLKQQARPDITARAILWTACMVGAGGALVFFFSLGLSRNAIMLLLALVIMWVGASYALDKYLDLDWESSQRVTGVVCGSVWVSWIVAGAVLNLVF